MNRDALLEAQLIELSRWQRAQAVRLGLDLAALDLDQLAARRLLEAKGLNSEKENSDEIR